MDRYEQRVREVSIGDVYELFDIAKQIQYSKQYKLKVGTELFVVEGNSKFVDSNLFPKTINEIAHIVETSYKVVSIKPIHTLLMTEVKYKSKFKRFFKWVLKYPIASVVVEVVS